MGVGCSDQCTAGRQALMVMLWKGIINDEQIMCDVGHMSCEQSADVLDGIAVRGDPVTSQQRDKRYRIR
jgi:hypothetical protein